jgi:hypothetical protein
VPTFPPGILPLVINLTPQAATWREIRPQSDRSDNERKTFMADEKPTLGIALAMETLKQGASRSAEEAYKALAVQSPVERPPWELLDQEQKEALTLIWFAGFLAGRAVLDSSS